MAKGKEKEKLFLGQRKKLDETTSSSALSKPKQNQSNGDMLFPEAKVLSETTENIQNKSESENQKAQKTQIVEEKEGWNSKFSGILGGQGGLGWVQGKQLSNKIYHLWHEFVSPKKSKV